MEYCANLAENTLEKCSNGIDDDGDGFTDCEDYSCNRDGPDEVVEYCRSLEESTLEQCSNGIDDDGDGFIDCEDYSCNRDGPDEVVEYCRKRMENTFEKCSNGIDDDDNGYTDCEDFSCSRAEDENGDPDYDTRRACQESVGATVQEMNDACSDGLDNDIDGFVDCMDWDCSHNPDVTVCGDGPRVCE